MNPRATQGACGDESVRGMPIRNVCRALILPFSSMMLLLSTACTTMPVERRDARDPWERINRASFAFNDRFDRAIAHPVARAYHAVVPSVVQTGVSHFFSNASYPVVIANDLLQGKLADVGRDSGRILLNTTVGIAGLLDPASALGLSAHNEDFGQTLGTWGVSNGAYLMLPFLGPSTARDGAGLLVDQFFEPRSYLRNAGLRWGLWLGKSLDRRVQLLGSDALLAQAADKYVLVRSAYFQRREYLTQDGRVSEELQPE